MAVDTGEGPPLSILLSKKFISFFFYYFFFRRCTIISNLDFDFERVLKLQQPLHFPQKTQALCKSSKTIDDMKLDSSSDSGCKITYSSSEENSDNETFVVSR